MTVVLLLGMVLSFGPLGFPGPAQATIQPLTPEADGPLQVWEKKLKFFLVIAVDQTGVPGTELPFAETDGTRVKEALEDLGYTPLLEHQAILSNPTSEQVTLALQEIRDLPDQSSVIVYYSGHGVAEPTKQDVWLQMGGQSAVRDHLGVSLTELVNIPRGASYGGELYVIVDACFSGLGGLTTKLSLRDLGPKTAILTSNILQEPRKGTDQPNLQLSYPITLEDGTQLSAFTYTLLQALGADWPQADDNQDGILQIEELKTYSRLHLAHLFQQDPNKAMEPQLIAVHDEERFVAYKREQVVRWDSTTRQNLQLVALDQRLVPPISATPGTEAETPEIPQEAQALAKALSPAPDDFYALGVKAQAEGNLEEAETLFQRAEQEEEAHKDKLAKIYLARGRNQTYQGQYEKALPWYQKTLALKPTRDPERLNEYGKAFYVAGRYEEALPLWREALALREKTLSPNDPDLGTSLNNLALLYETQGKYADAEPLYQRALRIRETSLGPDHPDVGQSLNNLALLYETQGKYADAEPLYQRVITIFETALGADHPNVATSLNNLAGLYQAQGKYADAEPLYQRSFVIFLIRLGPDHPYVAKSIGNYQAFLEASGQPSDEETVIRKLQDALKSIQTQSAEPAPPQPQP